MKTYAGVPENQIDENAYLSYASVDSFVAGLKQAGTNPTQQQFINAMLSIRSYNAARLYGSHTIGLPWTSEAMAAPAPTTAPG